MDDRIEVTEENFGELLIQGLEEAIAYERGELKGARVHRRTITARHARVPKPPRYTAERILRIRERMKVSQPVFADLLNVGAPTVRAWEQGKREPAGSSCRLLEMAEKCPETLIVELGLVPRRSKATAGV